MTRPMTASARELYDDPELHADDCAAVSWRADQPFLTNKDCNCALASLSKIEAEAAPADGLREALERLVEWAEGDEGQGCHWCLFSEGHEGGCLVGEACAALATTPAPALDAQHIYDIDHMSEEDD